MPVYENERGTYIFNSKDLCMIEHMDDILTSGIDSLKIEGRMKTALYVATVARTYRKAIDDYFESPKLYRENMEWYKEQIMGCTYRLFTTGSADNYGFYSNAEVDKALTDARTKTEDTDRAACYAEFQKAFAEDPAYDLICYLDALYAGNKRISGPTDKVLGHHGAGIFWNIEDWTISE